MNIPKRGMRIMFRLANIEDKRLQTIINKELINGFDDEFAFSSNDTEAIISNIEIFCEEAGIPFENKIQHDVLIMKIKAMYDELLDESYQYTFDEFGELIFARLLLRALDKYEFFLACAENTPDEYNDEPGIEDYWESTLSEEDIEYVRSFADKYFASVIEDLAEDPDEDPAEYEVYFAEKKLLFIDRITFFPLMALELTEDVTPEFLFWDRDFLLVAENGPGRFENMKESHINLGNQLGLSTVTEHTQIYSGSERFDLD